MPTKNVYKDRSKYIYTHIYVYISFSTKLAQGILSSKLQKERKETNIYYIKFIMCLVFIHCCQILCLVFSHCQLIFIGYHLAVLMRYLSLLYRRENWSSEKTYLRLNHQEVVKPRLQPNPVSSFIQQIFVEHLLCLALCKAQQPDGRSFCPLGTYSLVNKL